MIEQLEIALHDLEQLRLLQMQRYFSDLRFVLENRCESPIEQMFLLALVQASSGDERWTGYRIHINRGNPFVPCSVHINFSGDGPATGNFTLIVYPQQEIQLAPQLTLAEPRKVRVDFLLELQQEIDIGSEQILRRYVIELDGHAFHERTSDQAVRDKSRDRVLQRAGYRVMRFTGSEVHGAFTSEQTANNPMSGPAVEVLTELLDAVHGATGGKPRFPTSG